MSSEPFPSGDLAQALLEFKRDVIKLGVYLRGGEVDGSVLDEVTLETPYGEFQHWQLSAQRKRVRKRERERRPRGPLGSPTKPRTESPYPGLTFRSPKRRPSQAVSWFLGTVLILEAALLVFFGFYGLGPEFLGHAVPWLVPLLVALAIWTAWFSLDSTGISPLSMPTSRMFRMVLLLLLTACAIALFWMLDRNLF